MSFVVHHIYSQVMESHAVDAFFCILFRSVWRYYYKQTYMFHNVYSLYSRMTLCHLNHPHSWQILTLSCPAGPSLDFFFHFSLRSCNGSVRLRETWMPVLAATTNPPPRVKFFSLTHSIPPNTIDLTYWREGAWLLRGIWPKHIEQAVGRRRTETDKKKQKQHDKINYRIKWYKIQHLQWVGRSVCEC